jgi:hypothetical protein
MSYGRNGKDANGKSRRLCLELTCKTRISGNKSSSKIIDRNYCAKHQPIDIETYMRENNTFPKRYFNDNNKKRLWFDYVFRDMGIDTNNNNEIYNVPRTKLKEYNGYSSIENLNSDNITDIIIELYPENKLVWHKFNPRPYNSFDNVERELELFDYMINEDLKLDIDLSINEVPDNSPLYNLELKVFDDKGYSGLFNNHLHSVYKLIHDLCPHLKLKPWLFSGLNYYFVEKDGIINLDNIKEWFMFEIFPKYNFPDELTKNEKLRIILLNIHLDDFKISGGSFIWNHFNGSVWEFICKIFPECQIKGWELSRIPQGYFDNEDKLKELFEYIANEEDWLDMNDYYKLTWSIIRKYTKCESIFRKFEDKSKGSCIVNALNYTFPEYNFDIEKFKKPINNKCYYIPLECYNPTKQIGKKNLRILLENHLQKLGFNTIESHYSIRYDDFRGTRLNSILKKYFNYRYISLLEYIYPENNYDLSKFKCNKFNYILYGILNKLCIENNIDTSNITFEKTYDGLSNDGFNMLKFDACIKVLINNKEYDILFEKDGIQHFESVKYFGGEENFKKQRRNDNMKHDFVRCNENLLLIRISYKETRSIEIFNNVIMDLFKKILSNITLKIIVSNSILYNWIQ